MPIDLMGCCGAYCATCKVLTQGACKGCKTGYASGQRDILKAKCPMKVCCIKRSLISCADCTDYPHCEIIHTFYGKNGYKYRKYQQAIEFIRINGYDAFFEKAADWKNAYGK